MAIGIVLVLAVCIISALGTAPEMKPVRVKARKDRR